VLDFLQSPRRRRRLAWTVGLAVPPLVAVALIVFVPNTGESLETPIETGGTETQTVPAGPPLAVTPDLRREVGETVDRFARTAVVRRRLDDAWPLASPTMRAGISRAQWRRGDIPVQPYPANALESVDWRIVERCPASLLLDVSVLPKRGSGAVNAVYSVELSARGRGAARRFLVDSWVPLATLGGDPGEAAGQGGGGREGGEAAPPQAFDDAKLGAEWFLVPAGIVGLLVLTLVVIAVRGTTRRRRAERAYREQFRS
jgi:hypothetical protein